MPAGKRKQTSAMFYALITFVGLFVAATTVGVIYYVKAEKYRTNAEDLQRQIDDLASRAELQKIGALVGRKLPRKSRLGAMLDHLDTAVSLIIGGPVEATSAEVKVDTALRDVNDAIKLAQQRITERIDPNTTGLVSIIQKLKANLDQRINAEAALNKQLEELNLRFEQARTASLEKEQTLTAEKDKYHQEVLDITQKYEALQRLMEQTADERAQTLLRQLQEERANLSRVDDELLKTRAELAMTRDKMDRALEELEKIKPPPGREVPAYRPDGKIILVDEPARVVHLNIGAVDRVYRGLTFSVYDRNSPIPEDGRGKAEVEVFGLERNIAAARIVQSQEKNPVAEDDIVANLIWDSDKANVFVVAGEFDLNGDGSMDYDAITRIRGLIEKWGGSVTNNVSVQTDFVVLGEVPRVPREPTFEDLEVDPLAREKYQAAVQQANHYQEVQDRAEALRIPIFKYDRFLYFIGYKGQADKPGAF